MQRLPGFSLGAIHLLTDSEKCPGNPNSTVRHAESLWLEDGVILVNGFLSIPTTSSAILGWTQK